MENFEYNSPPSDLQISTESVLLSEYMTTLNPSHIQEIDEFSESGTNGLDGMYIFYGMGGILIFFAIYMLCYSYLIYLKEKADKREIELRRLNQRFSHPTYRSPPMNEGRIFIEDFEMPANRNKILPREVSRGCHADANEHRDIELGESQESRSTGDLNITFSSSQRIVERRYFPEDFQDVLCPNTTPKQVMESSRVVSDKSDNHDKMFGWMSTPPLCYSSPRESTERTFYPEDFQDLLCPNTTQKGKLENMKDQKSQECATATPSKSNGSQSTSPEERSKSSPTSPDIVRRRKPADEDTPRRPSSWR